MILMAKTNSLTKILAIIGAIVVFIDGVLSLIGALFNWYIPGLPGWGFLPALFGLGWLNAVILLVIGILAMISVDLFKGTIPFNGIWLLLLGIGAIVFGNYFVGAALLIIAAILWFLGKK